MYLRFKIIDKDRRILEGHVGVLNSPTEEMRIQLRDDTDVAIWKSGADIKSILKLNNWEIVRGKEGRQLAKYNVNGFIINDGIFNNVDIVDDFGQPCEVDVILPSKMFATGKQTWDFDIGKVVFDLPNVKSQISDNVLGNVDITKEGYNEKDAELYAKAPILWKSSYTVGEVLDKMRTLQRTGQRNGPMEDELKAKYTTTKALRHVKELENLTEDEAAVYSLAPQEWKDQYTPKTVAHMMANGCDCFTDDDLRVLGFTDYSIDIYNKAPTNWKRKYPPKEVLDKMQSL